MKSGNRYKLLLIDIIFWFLLLLTIFPLGAVTKHTADVQGYIQKGEYEKAIPILEEDLKKNPSDKNIKQVLFLCYFQMGIKKFQANELASAANYFHLALNLDPSSLPARQNLALTLFKLGNLKEAKKLIEEGLNTTPPDRELLLLLAQIYQEEQAMDKVVSTLEEIHMHYPKDREVGIILANFYYSQLKISEARRIYQDLAKEYPEDPQLLLLVAKTYEDEGKWKEAIEQYEKLLQKEPKNLNIYRRIGRIYEKENKLDEGITIYERALKTLPQVGEIYIWLGELWEKKGDINSALENYKRAADMSVEHPLPYFKLADKSSDPREKELLLKQAVNKGVRVLEQLEQKLLIGLGERTTIESLRGSLELAEEIEKLEKVLRSALDSYLFPSQSTSSENAEDNLQRLLKRYPHSRIILEYTGAILEKRGEFDKALEIWRKILQRNPNVQRAHLGMGKAYEAKGEWEKARNAYRKALELDEKDQEAYEGLIRMSEKTGKLEELIREWERKAKFPSYRSNVLFLTRLEELLRKIGRANEADEFKKTIEKLKEE